MSQANWFSCSMHPHVPHWNWLGHSRSQSHSHIHIHVHIRCGCFSMIIKCGRRRSPTDHLYAAPVMSPGRDWRRRRRYPLWRPPLPPLPAAPTLSPRAALINYATLPPPAPCQRLCTPRHVYTVSTLHVGQLQPVWPAIGNR